MFSTFRFTKRFLNDRQTVVFIAILDNRPFMLLFAGSQNYRRR